MTKLTNGPACGAWVLNDNSPVSGARRVCVLAAGHYDGPPVGTHLGQWAIKDGESWHTDCPNVPGLMAPLRDHTMDHPGARPCAVWSDIADGAHPSDVTEPLPASAEPNALTPDPLPQYHAQVKIGDTGMSVHGPAKFVATVIRAFADGFEDEAER